MNVKGVALSVALFASLPGSAAVFSVTATNDAPDAFPGDSACASPEGHCTLRAAVMEANALPGPDQIFLAAGYYLLTIPGSGEDLADRGDLDVLDDLVVTGSGRSEVWIDAAGISRAFNVSTISARHSLELRDLTITGGNAAGPSSGNVGSGGAILCVSHSVTLVDAEIVANHADQDGGGIFASDWCSLDIRLTRIAGNTARNGGGIAARAGGVVLFITDSEVVENTADGEGGGILRSVWGSTTAIVDSVVARNTAGRIGGVSLGDTSYSLLDRVTIADNTAVSIGGLRIGVDATPPDVRRSRIVGNRDVSTVGGVFLEQEQMGSFFGNEIADNESEQGVGGLLALGYFQGSLTYLTVSGNRGKRAGGLMVDGAARVGLGAATVTGNSADVGGGIRVSDGDGEMFRLFDMGSSIVAGNSAPIGPDCQSGTGTQLSGRNLVGVADGCDFLGSTDLVGSEVMPLDARLDALAENGGPTRTHALLPGSPAKDAYSCSGGSDVRGVARPQGDGCDIGPFESNACANRIDDDGDGVIDSAADPGCKDALATREDPKCQDGLDNDGDGLIDFDGGASVNGGVALGAPDPECVGRPWRSPEAAGCGLGVELVGLIALRRRLKRTGDRGARGATSC